MICCIITIPLEIFSISITQTVIKIYILISKNSVLSDIKLYPLNSYLRKTYCLAALPSLTPAFKGCIQQGLTGSLYCKQKLSSDSLYLHLITWEFLHFYSTRNFCGAPSGHDRSSLAPTPLNSEVRPLITILVSPRLFFWHYKGCKTV